MKNSIVEELAKEYRKTTPNQMYGDELGFIAGFLCREKEVNKIILDKLNKLRSDLSAEQKVKLTKIISKDKIEALKLQIEILIEIQNRLK